MVSAHTWDFVLAVCDALLWEFLGNEALSIRRIIGIDTQSLVDQIRVEPLPFNDLASSTGNSLCD